MAFDLFGVGWLGRLESCFVLFFLVSFWIFDLRIDMDFITLSFFNMSTPDFIGDGRLSSHDFDFIILLVVLHRHLVEKNHIILPVVPEIAPCL